MILREVDSSKPSRRSDTTALTPSATASSAESTAYQKLQRLQDHVASLQQTIRDKEEAILESHLKKVEQRDKYYAVQEKVRVMMAQVQE